MANRNAASPSLPWQGAPRRPVNSWQAAGDAFLSANPEAPQRSEMNQEASCNRVGGELQEAGEDGDDACQAKAVGGEKLFAAFQSRQLDGSVPVDQLPSLFQEIGLSISAGQVETAVTLLCSEVSTSGAVTYPQCQKLFIQLEMERHRHGADIEDETRDREGKFSRWIAGMSDDKSTNLLLMVVVMLCCISAFLAAGVAILLLVDDETKNVKSYLQDNLDMVKDTVEVYDMQIAINEVEQRQAMFVTTLSSVLEHIAYSVTVNANAQHLFRMVTSVADTLSTYWESYPTQSFIHLATLISLLADNSISKYGLNDTVSIFDEVNNNLPSTYEVLLGQWQPNSTSDVEFLTQLRNLDACWGVCNIRGNASAPMAAALSGITSGGNAIGYDKNSILTGYTSIHGLGVQINMKTWALQEDRYSRSVEYVQKWTATSDSWQYMIGANFGYGSYSMFSWLPGCDYLCSNAMVAPGMPLYRALQGETGTMTFINYFGVKSVAAFAPIPGSTYGLAVQMDFADILTMTLQGFASVVDRLNGAYPSGTEEIEATSFSSDGNTTNLTHLSAYRFGNQCPGGQCVLATEYVRQAAQNCSTGVMRTTDYRGKPVLVGYSCISEVSVVLSMKIDLDELDADLLAAAVEAVNDRTAQDNGTSAQFLVATPKSGLTAAEVQSYLDFEVVSKLKYPKSCATPDCTWNRESALYALQNRTDVIDTTDYRNVAVMAAPSLSSILSSGVGMAVELDRSEALQPMIDLIIEIVYFSVSMVAGCTIVLVLVAKYSLRSMIRAREEGKQAVEKEKNRFSKLVASMYPPFVVPRLLEGDKQIVCEVHGAAVFFSDIHEFTSVSNTMGSAELLRLLGYVYGVMDSIADRFGVYKVKTIGDAYLAVAGLPGSDSENAGFDLLRFASFVCQVFGDRFVHPMEGQVLALMNRAMSWNKSLAGKQRFTNVAKAKGKDLDGTESVTISMDPSSHESRQRSSHNSIMSSPKAKDKDKVQCVMSYGLALGKIVAGVLAGRSPMFDIWGITVNLASRMQSTGEPGRIQVSEHLYHRVIADEGQPFSFEAPRKVFCKGFGNVNAYMVRTTIEGLPKDIQSELGLEPRYGAFHFDNLLSKLSGPEASASEAPKPTPPSESQKPTPTSPNLSAHPERTVSIVLTPSNGKQRAPIVNEQRRVSGRTGNSPKAVN
eukprot:GGOE01048647.1.p1 GENE.GGOE01048647.1~~GGOE01048647.1.p1  ORF type:complete len:1227 (-),score=355.69 GGOE01048647.1:693-4226(-)